METLPFLFLVGFIGAAAIVAAAADAKVVITGNRAHAAFADFVDDLVRPDVITYQIAKTINGVGFAGFDIKKASSAGRLA